MLIATATELAQIAKRLPPEDASRLCTQTARTIADAFANEYIVNDDKKGVIVGNYRELAFALGKVTLWMDPQLAAQMLADIITAETDWIVLVQMVEPLAAAADRLAPNEAARVCLAPARALVNAEKIRRTPADVAAALPSLARHLNPAEARQLCNEAVVLLTDVKHPSREDALVRIARHLGPEGINILAAEIEKRASGFTNTVLTEEMARLAKRLEPQECRRICLAVVEKLSSAIEKEPPQYYSYLLEPIRILCQCLPPDDARPICEAIARDLLAERLSSKLKHSYEEADREKCLSRLIHLSRPHVQEYVVRRVASIICADADSSFHDGEGEFDRSQILVDLLTGSDRPVIPSRIAAMIGACGAMSPFTALPFLPAAAEPLPCRLTDQELVELLKMPTCFGPARRVVLDQLENRYKRRFCNHWAFVRYAEENGLNLDFKTPPKRPGRTLTWPEGRGSRDVDPMRIGR
jgi:hypothetical protein